MTEKVFKIMPTEIPEADEYKVFYNRVASALKLDDGVAGLDEDKREYDVKLCVIGFGILKVTWDEQRFPELGTNLASLLSGFVQREPSALAASAEQKLANHRI